MRTLLALALLSIGLTATAQTTFRLVDPLLSVDGERVATLGTPLAQDPFGVLTITVPGAGTYSISERPFAGARRAGQFDGAGLYFATAGRSVRLVSRDEILSLDGPTSAYVRYEPSPSRGARGPARLSIADDEDGSGRRPIVATPARTTPASGPRPTLSTSPTGRVVRDAEVQRLRGELDRLVADRQRLAVERDRLAGERDAARRAQSRLASSSEEMTSLSQSLARMTTERDRLARERDRLTTERSQLSDALARAATERAALAAEFGAVRLRAEAAEASAAGWARSRDQTTPLRTELAELRTALQERDRALDWLRAEQVDRSARLPSVESSLSDLRTRVVQLEAERDRALADRDRAFQLRDDAVAALDRSVSDAEALRTERDRLLAERDGPGMAPAAPRTSSEDVRRERDAVAAEREALIRDRALLDADRASLAAERDAFEAMRGGAPRVANAGLDDRQALLDQLTRTQAEREALMAERDRLQLELQALRTRPVTTMPATPAPVPPPRSEPQTVRTPTAPADGAVAFLPGFDFGRLGNPDVIRRRLDEAEYPRWATVGRIEGDVLVLFQTDRTGRVVSTAVPTPIGGGLDGLAEEIVREMWFSPTSNSSSGLRSQVVVRFEL